MAMFYRQDLFDQWGIEPPTTWTEYEAAAREIRQHGAYGQSFTPVASGTWPGDDDTVFAQWAPTSARYVRFTATGGVGGYASAAELRIAYDDGG